MNDLFWQNPLAEMDGPHFLILYTSVAASVLLYSFRKVRWRELDGKKGAYQPDSVEPYHLAYLRGRQREVLYQPEYGGAEHSLQDLIGLVQQYQDLLTSWRRTTPNSVRGQITVTGGEPMVRSDFLDLLKEFASRREHFRVAILTNGNLVTPEMAHALAEVAPRFVQVSIEGTEATHNAIRGPGNYGRVVAGIRALQQAGVRTFISLTALRGNFREFNDVARRGRELGVSRVWTDRLIQSGSGAQLSSMVLSREETREFCQLVAQERQKRVAGA